jgi:hypothetical protein
LSDNGSFVVSSLEEIRKASIKERRSSIIMLVENQGSQTWYRESADSLADQIEKQELIDAPSVVPIYRGSR